MKTPSLLLITLALAVATHVSAQVRGYTVGIDVNCPSGLGE
jgi:hypothetical protein